MVYLAITAAIFTLDFFLKKYIDKKYARKVKNSTSRWNNLHREVLQQRCNVKSSRKTSESHDCDTQCHHGFCGSRLLFCNADDWKKTHKNGTCHVSRRRTEQFI